MDGRVCEEVLIMCVFVQKKYILVIMEGRSSSRNVPNSVLSILTSLPTMPNSWDPANSFFENLDT